MPRIEAPTVAEHREQRRTAILEAARVLMIETGEPPSMGQVGRRAGLARSSVYQYFDSVEELLAAVAAEVFPTWSASVRNAVATATTPGEKVWAYIAENFALFSSPELGVIQVLARVIAPQDLDSPMQEFHRQLQDPLRQALIDLGEPEPETMARFIDALIVQATHDLGAVEAGQNSDDIESALASLRRLIAGYLGGTSAADR